MISQLHAVCRKEEHPGEDERELNIRTVFGAIDSTSRGHSHPAHKIAP